MVGRGSSVYANFNLIFTQMKYVVMDIMLHDIHFVGTMQECIAWQRDKGFGYEIKPLSMKSHRSIKAETFAKAPKIKIDNVEGAQKIPDSLKPTIRTKVTAKYRNVKQSIKNSIMAKLSKTATNKIRNSIPDNTWWGKLLFAVLDVLPIPNIHEVWKAVNKEIPDGSIKDKTLLFWEKIDGVRTSVAIAVALAGYYQLL